MVIGDRSRETICQGIRTQEAIIGPCEKALKCPQGAMKYRDMGCLPKIIENKLKIVVKKT